MTDVWDLRPPEPVLAEKIPASTISEDVELVMDSEPFKPVDWDALKVSERLDQATRDQLLAMAKATV